MIQPKVNKAKENKKISIKDKQSNTADSLDFESRKKIYSQVNKELKNVKRSSNLDEDNKSMKQYNELAAKKFKKDRNIINSKKYATTKLEKQNTIDAVRGVNKNPQVSDMIGIPMDNASIKHLRSKFNK